MSITYNVYRDGKKIETGLTAPTFTDSGLEPNTTYEYRVSAENEVGESPLSDPVVATTSNVEPEAPENLRVTGTTSDSVDLEWD